MVELKAYNINELMEMVLAEYPATQGVYLFNFTTQLTNHTIQGDGDDEKFTSVTFKPEGTFGKAIYA